MYKLFIFILSSAISSLIEGTNGLETINDFDEFNYNRENGLECQYGTSSFNEYHSEYSDYF